VDPHFLDPNNDFPHATLATFNRCGSTMLRFEMERICELYTNHDFTEDFKQFFSFHVEHGMQDYAPDDQVFLTKSHYNHFLFRKFQACRGILLVRNPFDVMISYFHLKMSGTHDKDAAGDAFAENQQDWEEFANVKFDAYEKLYTFWLAHPIPKYIIRFEDLMSDKRAVYLGLFQYILNQKDLTGTLIEKKIDLFLATQK
jgi:hypothetical protein